MTAALIALFAAAPCLAVGFEEVPATFLGAPVSLGAMSGDGTVMAGHTTAAPFRTLRWATGFGWQNLGAPPANNYGLPAAVSYDGSAIAAAGDLQRGYRWKLGIGWQDVFGQTPRAISADGSMVAGHAHATVIYPDDTSLLAVWREGVGASFRLISGYPLAFYVRAVTADGSEVIGAEIATAGSFYSYPLRVLSDWTRITLPLDPAGYGTDCHNYPLCEGDALAISADGGTLVGSLNLEPGEGDPHAARWVDYGPPEFLERPPTAHSIARDVSGNGEIVVGQRDGRAFVWTPWSGMQDLQAHLEASGIDLTGWTLENALAISDAGTTIAGTGKRPGGANAIWRVVAFEAPPQVPAMGTWGAAALALALLAAAGPGRVARARPPTRSTPAPGT